MLRTQTALLVLLTPVLLSWVFARTARSEDFRKPIALVVEAAPSGLVRVLKVSEAVIVREVPDRAQAEALLRNREGNAILEIPAGFDEQLAAQAFPQLQLHLDESAPTQVAVLREALRAALREQSGQELPADIRVSFEGRRKEGAKMKFLSLWLLFALVSSLAVSASSMLEEKEAGTLQQILLSPASLSQVILGKVAAGSLLAGASALFVLLLNAPTGASWSSLALLLLTGVVAFSSLGTLVGILAEGATATNAWTGLLFLALFVPVSLAETSQTMSAVAHWSPAFYLYDGLHQGLVGGSTVNGLAQQIGVLVVMTLAVVAFAGYRLKRASL